MKNKINYLFLFNTLIIWISTFILFIIYLVKNAQGISINKIVDQTKTIAIVLVILALVIVCIGIGVYYYLLYHQTKKNELNLPKKMLRHIYYCTFYLFVNLILCSLFNALTINVSYWNNLIIFISISFALSTIFMIGIGFYSYYLDVGYNFIIDNARNSARKEQDGN